MNKESVFTQKYTLVQFIEVVEVGYQYESKSWPLHVTLVDAFAINWSVEKMVAELKVALKVEDAAVATAEGDALFGENKDIRVALLTPTASLIHLHQVALQALASGNVVLNDPWYAGDGYVPHATVQQQARLDRGDIIEFNELAVVDMYPDANPYSRKVLAKIHVGAET